MKSPIATFAAGAVALALAAAAAPATADPGPQNPADFAYVATIDCGRGNVQVGSGTRLFAPLVNMDTGRRYWPVAWKVRAGAHEIRARKKHRHGRRTLRCRYNDGQAKGIVTIHRPKDGRPAAQAPAQ
jgi:hypothetical protein